MLLVRPMHFIMQRKQLLGIARRAESEAPARSDDPPPVLVAPMNG